MLDAETILREANPGLDDPRRTIALALSRGSYPRDVFTLDTRGRGLSEYDPDWDPRGVQSFSAEGESGRAPIIFIHDPAINREPPPGFLGTAAAYHGFGRILDYNVKAQTMLGDFPGGRCLHSSDASQVALRSQFT